MKLKIKQVNSSPEYQQKQQENDGDREILKEEVVEVEDNGTPCQFLNSAKKNQPSSSKSSDTNKKVSNLPEWLPTTPVSQNQVKRKRRPKLLDEISLVTFRRRKKKPSDSQSAQVIPDSEGKCANKKEKVNVGMRPPVQMKSPTLIRAEELQSRLGNEYPSFTKLLVRSHVGSCFWMGLPVPFCKPHLPKKDVITILEDENKGRFEVKYIAEKTGLSAGWRKFVVAHRLVEGDVLTFQLIGPTTFKVYVTRANDINAVDGTKQSGNDSEEVASEVMESSKCSDNAICFKDVKKFEDFRILVNGVCIDSELPQHIRRKYYELCCSKNCFLHEGFLPGLHCKLASGMILEAVNTADAIRRCKVMTPRKEFEKWDKSLKSFELLGMSVGFLRDRLRWLLSLAFDAEEAVVTKKYWVMKTKRGCMEDEVKDVEAKLMELKEACEKYDADIDALKTKAESYELMFHQEVNALW